MNIEIIQTVGQVECARCGRVTRMVGQIDGDLVCTACVGEA